jgi:hypothetical protein
MSNMDDGLNNLRRKIRDDHRARKENAGDFSEDIPTQDREVAREVPKQLRRLHGESPRARALRIREQAFSGDEVSMNEWMIMRGQMQGLQGGYKNEGFTGYNPDGSPREGFEWTPEEESCADKDREKTGE